MLEWLPSWRPVLDLLGGMLPFESMDAGFARYALAGLLLLAPMSAAMGVQVVNLRMAFFSDAVGHAAFTGIAVGVLAGIHPHWSMPIFGVVMGLGIMATQRNSRLSGDTVIGVCLAAVVAFGLAVVSRDPSLRRGSEAFLFGDILTVDDGGLWALLLLALVVFGFLAYGYNRLLYLGLHGGLAEVHGVRGAWYQYTFAALLALVVIQSIPYTGVLLMTAMMVVPAAAARNLARTAGGMLWWAVAVALVSAVGGLLISFQPWINTATGATVVLVAFVCFLLSLLASRLRRARG